MDRLYSMISWLEALTHSLLIHCAHFFVNRILVHWSTAWMDNEVSSLDLPSAPIYSPKFDPEDWSYPPWTIRMPHSLGLGIMNHCTLPISELEPETGWQLYQSERQNLRNPPTYRHLTSPAAAKPHVVPEPPAKGDYIM